VLILDCCHSGAYGRGAKAALGERVGAGTALITAGYGRVVLTASDATQYAWDGEHLQGAPEASVFTRYLVEGLRTGAADLDGDGLINIDELYEYVYGRVRSVSSKQTPAKFADRQQGPIFIARSVKPTVNRALLPADLLEALTDRRRWIREGAVLELGRIFLDQHQGRAATARELLRQLADKDHSARVRAAARHMLGKRTVDTTAPTTTTTTTPTDATGTVTTLGDAQAPAPTGAGWGALWARWDEQAFAAIASRRSIWRWRRRRWRWASRWPSRRARGWPGPCPAARRPAATPSSAGSRSSRRWARRSSPSSGG
jgi:hypothetical protein